MVSAQTSDTSLDTVKNTNTSNTSTIHPRIVVAPISNKGTAVASGLLSQKLYYYYFGQSHERFQKKFLSNFVVHTPNDSQEVLTEKKVIRYWIKAGSNAVMIINLQRVSKKNSTNPLFSGRITLSHESEQAYLLDIHITISLREILLLNNSTLADTVYRSKNDSQKMLKAIELASTLPFALRVADLYFQVANAHEISDRYIVEIDNERLDLTSPHKITLYPGERFVKVIQQDKEGNETLVGTYFIHVNRENYQANFRLLTEEEKTTYKKISAMTSSWLMTDMLFGYLYQVNPLDSSHTGLQGGAFTSLMRITAIPLVAIPSFAFLRIGTDLSFFMKQSNIDNSITLQFGSVTAFLGGTYTFLDRFEFTTILGGGITFVTQSERTRIVASTEASTNFVPNFIIGTNFAYNIPMIDLGYLRVLLDIRLTNPVIIVIDENNNSTRQIPQWLGITAGLGWRY